MLNNLKARRDREEGFTLIELMVVVLIIAILIAIAIPTFLGARERAQDRAAQSSLRNALPAAKSASQTASARFDLLVLSVGIQPSAASMNSSPGSKDSVFPVYLSFTPTTVGIATPLEYRKAWPRWPAGGSHYT